MQSPAGYDLTLSVLKKSDVGALVGILQQALVEPDQEFRERTAAFLAGIENEAVERLLVRRFSDIGPQAQARLLGRPDAVLRAAEQLSVVDDRPTRANVVEALAALADKRSIGILLRYLDDPSVPVRSRARALLQMLAHRYGRQLVSSNQKERAYLRTALGLVLRGGHVTPEGLRALLALGQDGFMLLAPVLRETRSDAAAKVCQFLSTETSADTVRCLFYLASSAYEETRQRARAILKSRREGRFLVVVAQVLREMSEAERSGLLVTLRHLPWEVLQEQDLRQMPLAVQRLVLEIVQSYGGTAGERLRKILPFLRSPFTDIRSEALHALRGTPSKLLAPHLEPLLGDPSEAIALRATAILDPASSPGALMLLVKQLGHNSPHVREEAARKLSGRTFYLLNARWESLPASKRETIAGILSRVDRHFVAQLTTELEHGDVQRVRRALAMARGVPDRTPFCDTLVGLTLFPDPFVRATTARLLSGVRAEKAGRALERLLENRDGRVVANAAEALAAGGDSKVVSRLVPLLEHQHNRVQATAAVTLFQLGYRQVHDCIRSLLSHTDPAFRKSGAWAARKLAEPRLSVRSAPGAKAEEIRWGDRKQSVASQIPQEVRHGRRHR